VTVISSNAACGRADRLPGVPVVWRDGAPANGFSRAVAHGLAEAVRCRIGSEAHRVRIGARLAFAWRVSCRGSGGRAGRRALLGSGVFRAALREALAQGDIRRLSGSTFTTRETHRDHDSGGE